MSLRKFLIDSPLERRGILPKVGFFASAARKSPADRDAQREIMLTNLITHATKKVCYYRDLKVTNLCDFPPLTKEIIRANDLRASDIWRRNAELNTSGGSTGEPIEIYQCEQYRDWNTALKIYCFYLLQGVPYGEKMLKIWGSEKDYRKSRTLKGRLQYALMNVETLPCYDLTPKKARRFRRRWNRAKPKIVWGYMSCLMAFAEMTDGEYLHTPQVVISTSETLSERNRKKMESRFGCPVVVHYGSREVGAIATGCPHCRGQLHNHDLFNIVEILDSDLNPCEPGQAGDIYVTNLQNYAMPLIRYKIGDVAVPDVAIADNIHSWPLIKSIEGRISDQFRTRDGTRIHGERFTELFYHERKVKQFQVIQEACNKIKVVVVLSPDCSSAGVNHLKRRLRKSINKILGGAIDVKFSFVNNIGVSESGKRRYTISKCN